MSEKNSTSSSGFGLIRFLTIVFVVLKLTGLINWSWLWVLSPLWIGLVFFGSIVLIVFIIAALATAFNKEKK